MRLRSILFIIVTFFSLLFQISSKCVNSTDFKYDLPQVSSVPGEFSICSIHAPRTCCSQDNFDTLDRKYDFVTYVESKKCQEANYPSTVENYSQIFFAVLVTVTSYIYLYSKGQEFKEGVCSSYCAQIYDACSEDYFSFDAMNNLQVCRDEDIICSKMKEITGEDSTEGVCQLFKERITHLNCWNGQISALVKGRSKRVETKVGLRKPKKRTTSRRKEKNFFNRFIDSFLTQEAKSYFALLFLLVAIISGIWFRKYYRLWKRQIRNW